LSVQTTTIGSLDCRVVVGDPNEDTVIFLHGYGANWDDLLPLHSYIGNGRKLNWIFPNAPLSVPMGPYSQARAWFPINMALFEQAMLTGKPRDLSKEDSPEFRESSKKVEELISSLAIDKGKLILGGFSQGAMLSLELSLRTGMPLKHLILMSGNPIAVERIFADVTSNVKPPVYQSHGRSDEVLSFEYAENLKNLLINNGYDVDFYPFHGGHEIPPGMIEDLNQRVFH
jgi:phospholipase/carboxylesterase